MRFASGNVIKLGDVVLKEKQKGLSRKGGKFNTRFFESRYTVVDIINNGNCVLMSNKTNNILSTPCPMKHIKKYLQQNIDEELYVVNNLVDNRVSRPTSSTFSTPITNASVEDASTKVTNSVNNPVSSTVSTLTSSMVSTPITNATIEDASTKVTNLVNNPVSRLTSGMVSTPIMNATIEDASTKASNSVNNLVSSTPIIPTTSMDTRKRLPSEDEIQDGAGTKGTDGVILVEDMLNITQSEILSSHDEFSMLCVEETVFQTGHLVQ